MPNYHDEFWRFILSNQKCAVEFFQFILKQKRKHLLLDKLKLIGNFELRKKPIPVDLVFEIPGKQSKEMTYFLLEHKSRKEKKYYLQILQYKYKLREWQKIHYSKFFPIVPILFSQGLDGWDPEKDLLDTCVVNPILTERPEEILIFDLNKIDPLIEFRDLEMKSGMLLLKKIATPWDEFLNAWREIHKILQTIKKSKRIALEDAMSNYIFKSRKEDKSRLEEVIMGRRVLTAYERAVEEGKLEGILEGKLQIAKMMREEGDSFERIVRITGLSLEILKVHNLI